MTLHTPTITPSQARAKEIHDRLRNVRTAPVEPPPDVKVTAINTPLAVALTEIDALKRRLSALEDRVFDIETPAIEKARRIKTARIQAAVCEIYGTTISEMHSDRRTTSGSLPRQIAMHIARMITPSSFPQIGRDFGNKDASTARLSASKMWVRRRGDAELNRKIESICESLGGKPEDYELRFHTPSNGEQQCLERHPTLMQPSQNLSVPSPG